MWLEQEMCSKQLNTTTNNFVIFPVNESHNNKNSNFFKYKFVNLATNKKKKAFSKYPPLRMFWST